VDNGMLGYQKIIIGDETRVFNRSFESHSFHVNFRSIGQYFPSSERYKILQNLAKPQ